jgi:hypothetical protein
VCTNLQSRNSWGIQLVNLGLEDGGIKVATWALPTRSTDEEAKSKA